MGGAAFSNNRARVNEKKGGDKGIDGIAFFMTSANTNAQVVFQVKSGTVGRGDISKLNSDRIREGAELGVFLTLESPTQGMIDEARATGFYTHPLMGVTYPRVRIVTIEEMLAQEIRFEMPLSVDVLRTARAVKVDIQTELFAGDESNDEPVDDLDSA